MRTDQEQITIFEIALKMKRAGLEARFIIRAIEVAQEYRGAFGLLSMWAAESEPREREAIVADLQHEIEDLEEAGEKPEKLDYINFASITKVSGQLETMKQRLREEIEKYGGINKLSRETGIAQPYLSKLFNSGIKPRYTTLKKIYLALGLQAPRVAFGG